MIGWSHCGALETDAPQRHLSPARFPCLLVFRRAHPAAEARPNRLSRGSSAVFLISNAYAQTAAPASGGGEFPIVMVIAMMVVFFFVMVRPQMKRAKETKTMLEALAKGDEVVTVGGVLGRISKIGDTYVHIEAGPNVELQIQRSAIVQVLPKGTLK
jgi:preprotein translocase subunit YajC